MTVIVLSGAHGGIGRAVVRTLVDDYVVGVDVSPCDGSCATGECHVLDVSHHDEVETLALSVAERLGPPRGLVNVAGTLRVGSATDTSADAWLEMIGTNLLGVVAMSSSFGRIMARDGDGVIVTVASNSARVARKGLAAYGATKAAVRSYSMSLGLELAPRGVRCVVVEPGSTDTVMLAGLHPPGEAAQQAVNGSHDDYRVGIPLGRVAEADDVADVVAYLLSARARQITMTSVVVDGGASLGV